MASAYRLIPLVLAFVVVSAAVFWCQTPAMAVPADRAIQSAGDHQVNCCDITRYQHDKACDFEWLLASNGLQLQASNPSRTDTATAPASLPVDQSFRHVLAVAYPPSPDMKPQTPVALFTLLRL